MEYGGLVSVSWIGMDMGGWASFITDGGDRCVIAILDDEIQIRSLSLAHLATSQDPLR